MLSEDWNETWREGSVDWPLLCSEGESRCHASFQERETTSSSPPPPRPRFSHAALLSSQVCPFGTASSAIVTAEQRVRQPVGFVGGSDTTEAKLGVLVAGSGTPITKDYNIDIEVLSVTTNGACGGTYCVTGVYFKYKSSTMRTYFHPLSAVYDSVGNTDQYVDEATALELRPLDGSPVSTGVYVYWKLSATDAVGDINAGDHYYVNITWNEGVHHNTMDDNTVHQNIECSGRGTCHRGTGTCKCDSGWQGDACQRASCPKDCNGRGTCVTLKYFAQDASITYNGFDAKQRMTCACDPGFRGHDCSQTECPSSKDPLGGFGHDGRNSYHAGGSSSDPINEGPALDCSGRGNCDYSKGVCSCAVGYTGEACELLSNFV
jgi:hypothetical protein